MIHYKLITLLVCVFSGIILGILFYFQKRMNEKLKPQMDEPEFKEPIKSTYTEAVNSMTKFTQVGKMEITEVQRALQAFGKSFGGKSK
jgi:Tfp pilus assembly protein PilO